MFASLHSYLQANSQHFMAQSTIENGIASSVFLIIFVTFALFAFFTFAFAVWMLIDAATKPVPSKNIWVIIIAATTLFGFGFIPAVIYYFTDRKKFIESQKAAPQQQWQQQAPPAGATSVWPSTSPTANTEAPNPTDTPAAATKGRSAEKPAESADSESKNS